MITEFSRRAQCDGKRRYITRADAKRAAKRARRDTGDHYDTYECPHCWCFHYGHAASQEAKRRSRRTNGDRNGASNT